MVRFSNFSSPEYIMDLRTNKILSYGMVQTCGWILCPGLSLTRLDTASGCWYFSPWHPESPYPDISSAAHRLRRSTLQEPQWSQLAGSPS
uniref:Uncharacterized protein n=1 Tax=Cyprinodon variegatus TaxID=28743 RepID=A0A3Q2ECJ9_CYPVA